MVKVASDKVTKWWLGVSPGHHFWLLSSIFIFQPAGIYIFLAKLVNTNTVYLQYLGGREMGIAVSAVWLAGNA